MRTRNKKNRGINENENKNKGYFFTTYKENSTDEFEDDQHNLEARYLKELREYDTQMIQFDYERRALRRKRQALLDKERSLQRREKIINVINQNRENEPKFLPEDQNDIITLQKKLDVLHAEIDYQHALLLSVSKKSLARRKKSKSITIENSNYYFLSLKEKERDLLEKKDEIDSRQIEAKRILAEPIDDIRLEELLINDIEEDAELVENQYNSFGRTDEYENLNQIFIQLEELENSNRQRKKNLITRKSSVEQELKIYSNRKLVYTRRSPTLQKQIDPNISYSFRKEKVNQIINNICNSLAQRQKKLAELEEQIDEVDTQNKKRRIIVEKSYNQKVEKIKSYTLKMREIEHLKLKISEKNEKIENDRQEYVSISDKKKKIKRRITVILRDKDENSKRSAEHQDFFSSLNKKKENLALKDQKIQQRSLQIKELEREIKQKEKQLNSYEEKVLNLESQVSKIQKLNDEKIQQIQENTAQFEASRLAYLTKVKEEKGFLLDMNLN